MSVKLSEVTPLVCGILGGLSGGIAGWEFSPVTSIIGVVVGVSIGIAGFFSLTFPYVLWIIDYDERTGASNNDPPRVWRWLFLPLMITCIVIAWIVPWVCVKHMG